MQNIIFPFFPNENRNEQSHVSSQRNSNISLQRKKIETASSGEVVGAFLKANTKPSSVYTSLVVLSTETLNQKVYPPFGTPYVKRIEKEEREVGRR